MGDVLVVGGGISGIQAALDLANCHTSGMHHTLCVIVDDGLWIMYHKPGFHVNGMISGLVKNQRKNQVFAENLVFVP